MFGIMQINKKKGMAGINPVIFFMYAIHVQTKKTPSATNDLTENYSESKCNTWS